MNNNYTTIAASFENQLLDLEIVKLVFSKAIEKFEQIEKIINEDTDMNSSEKIEAHKKNYNNLRKEIVENSVGILVGIPTLISTIKIIDFYRAKLLRV